jgi:hypothetical protein
MTAREEAAQKWPKPPLPATLDEAEVAYVNALFGVGPEPYTLEELDAHRRALAAVSRTESKP